MPGTGRDGMYGCKKCPDMSKNNASIVFGVLLLMAFTTFLIYSAITQAKGEMMSAIIQIFTASIAYNAMANGITVQWPSSIASLLDMMHSATNVIDGYISLDCFLYQNFNGLQSADDPNFFNGAMASATSPFYLKSLVFAALPFFAVFAPMAIFLPVSAWRWVRAWRAGADPEQLDQARRIPFRMYTCAVVVLLFLLHPSITSNTMYLFSCIQLGPNAADVFLLADLGERCYTPNFYRWALGVGVPSFALYVIGIPVFFVYMLWRYQPRQVARDAKTLRLAMEREKIARDQYDERRAVCVAEGADAATIEALGPRPVPTYFKVPRWEIRVVTNFLQSRFHPEYYYWQMCIIARMAFLRAFVVYYTGHPEQQLLLACLVSFCALLAQLIFMPYIDFWLNVFEFVSLLVSFVEFYFGLFITMKDSTAGMQTLFAGIMTAVAGGFALFSLGFFLYHAWLSRKARIAFEEAVARGEPVFDAEQDEDDEGAEAVDEEAERLEKLATRTWRDMDEGRDAKMVEFRTHLEDDVLKEQRMIRNVLTAKTPKDIERAAAKKLKAQAKAAAAEAKAREEAEARANADANEPAAPPALERYQSTGLNHVPSQSLLHSAAASQPLPAAAAAAVWDAAQRRALAAAVPTDAVRCRVDVQCDDCDARSLALLDSAAADAFRARFERDVALGLGVRAARVRWVAAVRAPQRAADWMRVTFDLLSPSTLRRANHGVSQDGVDNGDDEDGDEMDEDMVPLSASELFHRMAERLEDPHSALRGVGRVTQRSSEVEAMSRHAPKPVVSAEVAALLPTSVARAPSIAAIFASAKAAASAAAAATAPVASDAASVAATTTAATTTTSSAAALPASLRCSLELAGFDATAVRAELDAFATAFAADVADALDVDVDGSASALAARIRVTGVDDVAGAVAADGGAMCVEFELAAPLDGALGARTLLARMQAAIADPTSAMRGEQYITHFASNVRLVAAQGPAVQASAAAVSVAAAAPAAPAKLPPLPSVIAPIRSGPLANLRV